MLGNLAVIENHNTESLDAVVVMWLRGLLLVRICIVVILTTASWLKYNLEGGQCYGVNIDVMALTTQFKLDAVFSH